MTTILDNKIDGIPVKIIKDTTVTIVTKIQKDFYQHIPELNDASTTVFPLLWKKGDEIEILSMDRNDLQKQLEEAGFEPMQIEKILDIAFP